MRKSYHTLCGIVNNVMGLNPNNGDVYIFINKRRNRMKLLHWEPEVTKSLVIVPAKMYVRCIVRHKFVLKSNLQIEHPERKAFEIAPLPAQPIHKCMASASVLTDLIINKYFYHLPFYRVIQKYKELGVTHQFINDQWLVQRNM